MWRGPPPGEPGTSGSRDLHLKRNVPVAEMGQIGMVFIPIIYGTVLSRDLML